MKIILDTDFIIFCLKNRVDILTQIKDLNLIHKVYIIDKTIDELKNKPLEKLAKTFIKKLNIIKTKKDNIVDNLILQQKNIIVATQDKELKEKLKKAKIPIITLRQKKYLILQNVL